MLPTAPMPPSRRSPRPPLCRRRLRIVGLRYRDCAGTRTSRPGQRHRLAAGWHGRPAARYASRSKFSLRGWACGFAPRATHNTYCAFVPLVPRFTPLFLIAPTLLTREPLRCGNKGSHNMALCDAPLLHCHADCFPPSPGGTRLPSSRGNHRASSQASAAPTQPLA